MPAMTCWSSSNALSWSAVRRAGPAACGASMPSATGSRPRRASSGSSTSTWSGSNTTTSPNVRGSTNHSSSGGVPLEAHHDVGVRRRVVPTGASSSWPLIRRWIINVSPVSSRHSRYLPRRPASMIVAPVSPSIEPAGPMSAAPCARGRPRPARSAGRPPVGEAAPDGLDLGQLRHRRSGRRRAGRTPRRPRPARRPSSTARPLPAHDAGDDARWRRTAWRGRVPRRG